MVCKPRGNNSCCDHSKLKQGLWTREEDEVLFNFVTQKGHGRWRSLPRRAGLRRCGKSCRLRWLNYLCPDIKRGNFTDEEDEAIIRLHAELGNKWSEIAAELPGRTDNEVKNVWNHRLKRKALERNKSIAGFFGRGGGLVVRASWYLIPAMHSNSQIWSVAADAAFIGNGLEIGVNLKPYPAVDSNRQIWSTSTGAAIFGNDLEVGVNLEPTPAVDSSIEIPLEASAASSGDKDGGSEEDTSYDLGESFWQQCLWPEI